MLRLPLGKLTLCLFAQNLLINNMMPERKMNVTRINFWNIVFFAPIRFAPCRRESFNKVIIALKHPYFTYELNLRSLFRSLSYTFKSAHMSYRIKKILLYICCFSSGMNFAPEVGGEQMWMGEGGAMFCRSGGAVGLVTLCRGDGEGSN